MEDNELISIIIIVYNTENYVEDCIKSVINQTYKKIEIIIVNDGSSDKSAQIINKYCKKDNRIIFINRKKNKGTMYTRAEGYNKSTGKYVMFVDSDDFLKENAVELMYKNLQENGVDIVKCNFVKYKNGKYIKDDNEISEKTIIQRKDFEPKLYNLLYKTIYFNTMCGLLVKKNFYSCVNNVNPNLIYGEDIQCNIMLYQAIKSIMILPECLYVYRTNDYSITNTVEKEKIMKKIDDIIICYYNVYCSINDKEMKKANYYKIITAEKMLHYLTNSFVKLTKVNGYKDIKKEMNRVINNSKVQEVMRNYNGTNNLKKNKLYKICERYFWKNKAFKFYVYVRIIYNPIYKTVKSIKNILK